MRMRQKRYLISLGQGDYVGKGSYIFQGGKYKVICSKEEALPYTEAQVKKLIESQYANLHGTSLIPVEDEK